jgi:hypothetical protein
VTASTDVARIIYVSRVFSLRRTLTLLAVLLGLTKLCACTVALDTKISQCQSDEDCARFGDSTCDQGQLLCVPRAVQARNDASTSSPSSLAEVGAAACLGKNGCYACAPKADPDFFNACSDARCVPFDNRRLRNLTADGMLKPLP